MSRTVYGSRSSFVSPKVDALTLAWGIPKARTVTVLRKGTEVVRSKDAGFYNDAVDIRAIARVGFGFLQPASVIRLYDADLAPPQSSAPAHHRAGVVLVPPADEYRVAPTAKTTSGPHPPAYPPYNAGQATAIAGAAIVLVGCGGSSQTAVTLTSTMEVTKTVVVTAPPPPFAPKTTMETDGTYRVGTDIVPGTYRRRVLAPTRNRLLLGEVGQSDPGHIINNHISSDPQVVTIQSSDTAFVTRSCQPWQKTD